MEFRGPFDAIVGRMVLMFCHDPSDTLCKLAGNVRPGGVIAFQGVDFTGCRSLPTLPTFNRCVRWIAESLERSGSDPYLGLKLYATFENAGLPALEEFGLATEAEADIETLTRRLSDEVVGKNGTVVGPSLVGASSRKPEESGRFPFSVVGGRTT